MPSLAIPYQTDAERRDLERAAAYIADMHQLAQGCPSGDLLDTCEGLALDKGRALLRDGLASTVQARIDAAETNETPPSDSRVNIRAATKDDGLARC